MIGDNGGSGITLMTIIGIFVAAVIIMAVAVPITTELTYDTKNELCSPAAANATSCSLIGATGAINESVCKNRTGCYYDTSCHTCASCGTKARCNADTNCSSWSEEAVINGTTQYVTGFAPVFIAVFLILIITGAVGIGGIFARKE